jgi:hypothetical protein
MRKLHESKDQFSAERERQALKVKLRLEKRKLEQEDNFSEAALILGQASTMGDRSVSPGIHVLYT